MTNTYELLELAKKATGINSDYGISELIKVNRQMISSWKHGKSEANAINTLKLMKAANISIDDALNLMTKSPTVQGEASKSNSDSLYIMLNSIRIKVKSKLFIIARKYDMKSICIHLLQTN